MIKSKSGFTIVELLIVIIVISILAVISIASYNGMQARAVDSERMHDLALLSKALQLHAVDKGRYDTTGCGQGWLRSDPDGAGPNLSMMDCLLSGGYLSKTIIDPLGQDSCSGLGCYAYMIYSCAMGTYLYAHLASKPQLSTDTDATCSPTRDTQNGMNYVVKVE